MEESEQLRERASLNHSKDLLCRLGVGIVRSPVAVVSGDADGVVELSLGLSLGGRFGVEKGAKDATKLERSFSFASLPPPPADDLAPPLVPLVRTGSLPAAAEARSILRMLGHYSDTACNGKVSPSSVDNFPVAAESDTSARGGDNCQAPGMVNAVGILMRTSSLPVETEESRRKRKELQSLKRMEVKRKRLERRNSSNLNNALELAGRKTVGDGGAVANSKELVRTDSPEKGKTFDLPSRRELSLQGAETSPSGSSNSGSYNFSDSQVVAGGQTSCTNPPSPAGNEAAAAIPMVASNIRRTSSVATSRDPANARKVPERAKSMGHAEADVMEEMPCVSTRGEGPDGRRVEGFLYSYQKGPVRIVCVCHGSFHTPAEFVRHAGGGDVAHPLRHIVVSSARSTFL